MGTPRVFDERDRLVATPEADTHSRRDGRPIHRQYTLFRPTGCPENLRTTFERRVGTACPGFGLSATQGAMPSMPSPERSGSPIGTTPTHVAGRTVAGRDASHGAHHGTRVEDDLRPVLETSSFVDLLLIQLAASPPSARKPSAVCPAWSVPQTGGQDPSLRAVSQLRASP